MDFFDVLNLVGGLSLFLFGMTLMGQALERRAGDGLKRLLGKLTSNKFAGLLTGIGVTAIIQSSSATTVMVVGFVNSGLMTLKQAINVIMGANIGTTVTAWILSLSGIDSHNFFVSLLKPSAFSPILALVGIILLMTAKTSKRKDTGMILLGFTTLMFGMQAMSASVEGLQDVPAFTKLFLAFSNPILGVLVGAILTAIIQSSSASVGILQMLASTKAVTYSAAVPIIMGQNIGTTITALLSSVGTTKNAKRAALVHLIFNLIGTTVWLAVFCIVKAACAPALLNEPATMVGIALVHSIFNILCTLLLFPLGDYLEKLVCKLIGDAKEPEHTTLLDERLLKSPALALKQCRKVLDQMALTAISALHSSIECVFSYDKTKAQTIREQEDETDHLEDVLGSYLVKVTSTQLGNEESVQATEYMKVIGDYERIADHAVNILESAEEMVDKGIVFSEQAQAELKMLGNAVKEILSISYNAFNEADYQTARKTEALEQVIDNLKELLRTRHILRLQKGDCTVDAGFVWSDLLTNMERVSDHCSNISGCVIDTFCHNMNIHENLRAYRTSDMDFMEDFQAYQARYSL